MELLVILRSFFQVGGSSYIKVEIQTYAAHKKNSKNLRFIPIVLHNLVIFGNIAK